MRPACAVAVALGVLTLLLAFVLARPIHAQDPEDLIRTGDYSRARAVLAPAASRGDSRSQYLLSTLYLNGYGVPRDIAESIRLLTLSATGGYPRAQSDLGALYLVGRYVRRDTEQAAAWLREAARQGELGAYYNLGVMYRDGLGVPRDADRAMSDFLFAARNGHALAQYGLARMHYEAGSYSQAAQWYQRAGDQGDLEALYNLGYMYHEGQGVVRDYVRANQLFLRVAEDGRFYEDGNRSNRALDMLGNAYRNAEGVERDYVEAYKWYLLAAARGHANAIAQMREMERLLTTNQIAEARDRAAAFARQPRSRS